MTVNPADYIILQGWALCLIEPGSKLPHYPGWNTAEGAIRDPGIAEVADGIGLLHTYSGTCCIDIDNLELALPWCRERGIPLQALRDAPDSVHIISGVPSRDKLLYRLKQPLPTVQPKGSGLELRCGTSTGNSAQDVLPPTVHPVTRKPYIWRGDWTSLPYLPASVLATWRGEIASTGPSTAPPTGDADVERLRSLVKDRNADCGYDEWVKIGMSLHHATKGGEDGLLLWDEWSRRGKKYKGVGDLRTHWISFRSDRPNSVTQAALERESAATPDEFQNIAPQQKPSIGTAQQTLSERLIYVDGRDQYYDLHAGTFIQNDHGLYHRFGHMFPRKARSRVDVAKILAESPTRQSVDDAGFNPGETLIYVDGGRSYLNNYKFDGIEPIEPSAAEREIIEWLFNRIDEVPFREWLRQFYAHMMQRPGIKLRSAPLFWSEIEGNGKTTMMSTIPKLLVGSQYSHEVTYAVIEDRFNGFMHNAWHICMTELKVGSRKEADAVMARIKPWITDEFVEVRAMRQDAVNVPNHLVITSTSNKGDALLLSAQDRRFGVYELKAPKMTHEEGNRIVGGFLKSARAAAVLRWYFLHVPIDSFSPDMSPPRTAAHAAMVEAALPEEMQVIRALIEDQQGVFAKDCGELEDVYREIKARLGYNTRRIQITNALRSLGAAQKRIVPRGRPPKSLWVWRNKEKWTEASTYEAILEHLDELV